MILKALLAFQQVTNLKEYKRKCVTTPSQHAVNLLLTCLMLILLYSVSLTSPLKHPVATEEIISLALQALAVPEQPALQLQNKSHQ